MLLPGEPVEPIVRRGLRSAQRFETDSAHFRHELACFSEQTHVSADSRAFVPRHGMRPQRAGTRIQPGQAEVIHGYGEHGPRRIG